MRNGQALEVLKMFSKTKSYPCRKSNLVELNIRLRSRIKNPYRFSNKNKIIISKNTNLNVF